MKFSLNKIKNSLGLTLIELIVSISIIAIIFSVIGPIMYSGLESYRTMRAQSWFTQDTTATFLLIEKVLENITFMHVADTHQLKVESDGVTYDFSFELSADGNSYHMMLSKDSGTPQLLMENIKKESTPTAPGFEFSYFDQNYSQSSSTTNVRTINMNVIMQLDEFQQTFTSSESVNYEQIEF